MPQSWARGWFQSPRNPERSDLDLESSRRWRCCRAWGRCRWEQSRFSQSASSSLRSSAPGPGPQEKLKKVLFEICQPHKKVTKIHIWRIFSTSGAAVLQKVFPVALGLAALRGHIALKSAALASAISHLYPHDQLSPQSAQNPPSRPAWCCCCRSDLCLHFSRAVVGGTRPRLRRITMTIAKYTIMFKIHLRQAGDPWVFLLLVGGAAG